MLQIVVKESLVRIMVADDQDRVRHALRTLLDAQPDFMVVAEAADVAELLRTAQAACPDVVLLDWELPGLAVSAALPVLRRYCPGTTIIVLSCYPEARAAALAAGADNFVSKAHPPERLLDAILGCSGCWQGNNNR
jgi:two-component system nitrate/nitrite response regulator NarL